MHTSCRVIPEVLRYRAKFDADKVAYVFDDKRYTWQKVDQLSSEIAELLYDKGVRKGTHVGILGVNSIQWVLFYYGVLKLSAVAVLLNYNYKTELKDALEYSDVSYLCYGESRGGDYREKISKFRDQLPKLREVISMNDLVDRMIKRGDQVESDSGRIIGESPGEEDIALMIFTSGTTSRPKGVLLSHGQLIEAMTSVALHFSWKEDIMVMTLPMYHGSGANCGILLALLANVPMVIIRHYRSKEVMEAIEKYRCTIFSAVPSMMIAMMRNELFGSYDLSSLKSGILSGAFITPENYRKLTEAFMMPDLLPAYGMTETSTLNTMCLKESRLEDRYDNVGYIFNGMELRIWDWEKNCEQGRGGVGEIQIRGKCIMKGYYNLSDKTAEVCLPDGWFRTGDAGYLDEKNRLHFCTRLSDLIIRGGENISPVEIEARIEQFSERIVAAKVVGVPDPVMQEELVAFIKVEGDSLEEGILRSYLKFHLACYKEPKYIFQVNDLPMTGSGKIDAKECKKLAENLYWREKRMVNNPYQLLEGVRVVEMTTYVAAPSAGRLLADWGAEVIKVEMTPRGDTTRFVVPLPGMKPIAYQFHNANKKSICVDLKTEDGREIMDKLLATANVFLTNTRAKSLEKLGLDYESLHKKFPSLIHAHLTGYGETGSMANEPGFDNVCYWALGGPMIAMMEKDTAPVIPPSSFGDNNVACTTAGAICAALYKQQKTGEGSKVVTSLFGQVMYNMTEPILSIQCSDLDKYPKTRKVNTPLNNTYICKDGLWIMVCCHEYERYFPKFMKVIGREDLVVNPEYNTFAKGNERSSEIIKILEDGFIQYNRDDLAKALSSQDIPHAILNNVPDLLDLDQAWDNKFLREFELHNGEKIIEAQTPVKYGGVTEPPRKASPYLGEQTGTILKELGYSEEQIHAWKETGLIVEKHEPSDLGLC